MGNSLVSDSSRNRVVLKHRARLAEHFGLSRLNPRSAECDGASDDFARRCERFEPTVREVDVSAVVPVVVPGPKVRVPVLIAEAIAAEVLVRQQGRARSLKGS